MSQSFKIDILQLLSDYIVKGNLEIIKFLLENITIASFDYLCFIKKAISANNSDIVKLFIEFGKKKDYDIGVHLTNTLLVAVKSNNLEIIKCYIDNRKCMPIINISIGLNIIIYVSDYNVKFTAIKYLFDNATSDERIKMYEHLMLHLYNIEEYKTGGLYNYIVQFKPIIPEIPKTPVTSTTTLNTIEHLEYQLQQLRAENVMLCEKLNAITLILADVKKI